MLHFINEGGNSELKNRRFPLAKGIRKHLQNTLDTYSGDKTVDGYKRLNNVLDMDSITYQEMKRIKNFFDNYKGTDKSVEFILNGGEPMKTWVNNTLNTATTAIHDFKQAKKDAGMNNAFIRHHEKDRQTHNSNKPTQVKIQTNNVTKGIADNNNLKFESKENKVIVITENQMNELNETYRDNEIFGEINKIILENLSVNDEVSNASNDLYRKINDAMRNAPIQIDKDKDNLKYRTINLEEEYFGYNVSVTATVYYYPKKDRHEIDQNYHNLNDSTCVSRIKKHNFIFFRALVEENKSNLKGGCYWTLGTIQHELNHIFQQINKGDAYATDLSSKSLYCFSNANIHSSDELVRTVAKTIYLTQTAEQDSFANELDAEIRSNISVIKNRNFYKNSEIYKRLLELKECHNYLLKNKNNVIEFLSKISEMDNNFNIKYGTLINLCEKGEKRILSKIANVIARNEHLLQLEYVVRSRNHYMTMEQLYLI